MADFEEALEIVFGQEFIDEMLRRLLIIGCSFAAVFLLVLVMLVWKTVAGSRVKKAVLSLSEHPDDEHAAALVADLGRLSPVGRFFVRFGSGIFGLSKSDCRTIFNTTVLSSAKIGTENKRAVRGCLVKIGFTGLTEVGE